ncbi:NTP transferase domain-containing protein [Microbacterium sp. LMC-P-041]|uniref:molybdenum cofactor guanylyltransferase n=1 Tax=Microbacterium sp. LMC-P-041 TaxID=3040293 RepID=UPI0025576866|nr:NTP transferase domain-containing protein [Microbacterium sp. LMC-P-041]
MTTWAGAHLGAILLAGGRGSRADGAAKPLFIVGGRTLLAEAADAAATAGAHPITVVSHLQDAALPVTWLRELSPFGGPVAAIVAALDSWPVEADPEWPLLLACDLPRAVAAVETLCDALLRLAESDGACLTDESGGASGSPLCTERQR